MAQLIFDESSMMDGNIFKFESRLKSSMNKYIENGAMFVTYFAQDENSSTVDRGTRDIEELFGNHAPLRYNEIERFPIYGFNNTNPDNTDELQIEDINVEGECTILPSTIIPKPYDFFIIPHIKQDAIFLVTNVQYDSMKVEGYYRIRYKLYSTSHERLQDLRMRVVNQYHVDMNQIGTSVNPIVSKDDYLLKSKIVKMVNKMIEAYRALFYNSKHNCFLFRDPETGMDVFDMCGNEFMAKYSLMNSSKVIVLGDKLHDKRFPLYYNNSIYNWIELGAPVRMLQKFNYFTLSAIGYPYSSFVQWGEGESIYVIYPLAIDERGSETPLSFFNDIQFNSFIDPRIEPVNDYESLIWKYINKTNLSINDISLYIGDMLISSIDHRNIFLYTPIIIYIIRQILEMQ